MRFMGMMPASEIEIEKRFVDESGYTILIQAGKSGWTIIYADYSSEYCDTDEDDRTAQENFDEAYNLLTAKFDSLREIDEEKSDIYNKKYVYKDSFLGEKDPDFNEMLKNGTIDGYGKDEEEKDEWWKDHDDISEDDEE